MIRAFLVDDEEPARRKLIRFLKDDGGVSVAGEASNGEGAVRGIERTAPDLVFLDIQMKGMDGFDVVRALDPDTLPRIVFVTAYDEYAMAALEIHAFGYLLKPFSRARLARVLDDFRRDQSRRNRRDIASLLAEIDRRKTVPQRLMIKDQERAFFVPTAAIDWIEAERNYVRVHAGERVHTVRRTLESLAGILDAAQFLQINRAAIVRVDFIHELQRWFHGEYRVILKSGQSLKWTRRYVSRRPEVFSELRQTRPPSGSG